MRDYDGQVALLALTQAGVWAYATRFRADLADVTERLLDALDGAEANVALALGADLGGNATSIGASANVVILGVSERAGYKIRFVEFLKYGVIVTAVTVSLSMLYLWLRYFVLA
jgi:Na+/H+ antiporter NhaD/arsenite permease-like protein